MVVVPATCFMQCNNYIALRWEPSEMTDDWSVKQSLYNWGQTSVKFNSPSCLLCSTSVQIYFMSGYQRFLLRRGFSWYKLWVLRIVIPRIADAIPSTSSQPNLLLLLLPPPPRRPVLQNNQYQRDSRETRGFVCLLSVETQMTKFVFVFSWWQYCLLPGGSDNTW